MRPDGTLDTSFHAPDGFSFDDTSPTPPADPTRDDVHGGYARPDGTLYTCGRGQRFSIDTGYDEPIVLRYTPDDQLDPAFGAGTGGPFPAFGDNDGPRCVEMRSFSCEAVVETLDGKLVVAGPIQQHATTQRPYLMHLSAQGALDPSFDVSR